MRGRLSFAKKALLKLGWERSRHIGDRSYQVGACLVTPPSGAEREPWMDAVYGAALDLGPGAVVDVGVNRMQTLFKILRLDPSRHYIGFEPQLQAALAAQDFARRNKLDHVEIVCAGLADNSGLATLRLHSLEGYDGAASITDVRPENWYSGTMRIPIIRGDEAIKNMGLTEIRIINADVEEAELEVVIGLSETLENLKPVLVFEVLNDWKDSSGNPAAEAISRMRDQRALELSNILIGFSMKLFAVRQNKLISIDHIERTVSNDLSLCNYVAVPEGDVEAFGAHFAARIAK